MLKLMFSYSLFSSLTSPTSDGAGAAVLASEDFVKKHHLESQAVEIVAQEMVTDLSSSFSENSCIKMVSRSERTRSRAHSSRWSVQPPSFQVGYDMTRTAAKKCFEAAGLKPSDIDVIELHDCFSANELITYEALGLCDEGTVCHNCINNMRLVVFSADSWTTKTLLI